jgi:hypothetical protein
VSLVTLVKIAEEKEPERASTPSLNASIQIHPHNEHEVESDLDVEPLGIPSTPMDSSKDELGSGGKEEEIPQHEINISMDDYQVSTKTSPDSLVLVCTLLANEKRPEVEPLEHIEEVQELNLEHIHTIGSLKNTLTWGEQQIPKPIDEENHHEENH